MKMWGGIAMMLCFLTGCTSTKQIAYLQDTPENYKQEIAQEYEIKIHSDDLLSIMVNSKDLELVQMFNLPSVRYEFGSKGAYSGGSSGILGYLVDKEGNIDFPQLGRIKVKGMTRSGLTDYIKEQLISKGLVNDPIVTIQFLNFKVSVMGEVNNPGTFEVSSDRITLLDVLSRAGDLTIYGKRENVKVIREENGNGWWLPWTCGAMTCSLHLITISGRMTSYMWSLIRQRRGRGSLIKTDLSVRSLPLYRY